MASFKPQASGRGQEPPMYLQRPSTGKSQDVRHILARTFRDLYTRDAVRPETVKNLQVSKGGDDPYHEKYVESLQKVYAEWQHRMDEAAMLERHIMQAQARAMSADERELNKTSQSCDNYSSLGLPPVRAHFRSCIDNHLLEKYDLLTPSDYMVQEPLPVPAPQGPKVPDYARETLTSRQHSRQNAKPHPETPLIPLMSAPGESMELPTFVSEDFQYVTSEDSLGEIEKKYPKKKSWKEYMSEDQREEERKALAMLHAKINYLQNPRHVPPSAPPGGRTLIQPSNKTPKEIGIQKEPDPIPTDSVVFLASPPIVEFKDYKVGEVYEICLELKNVSTVMRQCRVFPPSSNIFAVGLGQFPGESGLVAPGMSCKYGIRFAPDSLKDYDDSITVQTQATKPLIVSIRGRRNPPVLTLPSMLDLGSCLVGGIQATQLLIKNEGGPGRFCLMTRNKWPTTSIRTVIPNVSKITVKAPPFEVHPATFELRAQEATVLEVIFNPNSDKIYEQEMTVACDNCHVCHFTLKGEGEIARIGLADVELGLAEPKVGELNDKTAKNLLRFDDLNPFTYTEIMVKVMNFCKVELPYQWMVYKPIMRVGLGVKSDEDTPVDTYCEEERVPDLDSVFSVYPNNGVLRPSETAQFKFTFAPPTEGDFHSAIHMMLQHVPPRKEGSRSMDDITRPLTGDGSLPGRIEEENHNLMGTVAPFRDLTGLEMEVKGKCIPLNVVLHPYAIFMPGSALAGSTVKRLFTMANHSYSAITFQWEPYTDSYLLEVEPPFGELDPGMAMDLEISITGIVPGKIHHTLLCYVMNMVEPLHLHVQAEFKGPELRIGQPSIDFGLVRVGTREERTMTLINDAQMPVKFNIIDDLGESETDNAMAPSDLHFSETSGELLPLERRHIKLFFHPTCPRTFNRVCHVEYEGGNPCFIGVHGEAQNPVVCFLECEKFLPEVYLDVPVVFSVVMHNQTLLPSKFKWGEIEGSQKDDCKIEFQEDEAEIKSWEQKTISIAFTPLKADSFTEVRVPCYVQGQKEEIYVNLSCDVKTLEVSYKTSTDSHLLSDECQLDFGNDVNLGMTVTRYVHICNHTAISAPYTVAVEFLTSNIPQPPESNDPCTSKRQRRNLLSRTPNIADPMTKPPQKVKEDYNKIVLGKKKGAAFTVRPAHGHLQPFGEQIIEVCGLSDMWGKYHDNLIFKVGKLEPVMIPVDMKVTGCPLSLQLTAGQTDHKPVVRFGTHVSGVLPTTRRLKINNSSPNDIRIDWQVFEVVSDSEKLIDFITCFGRAFPQRDNQGNEIIPKKAPAPLLPPANMDVIVNSPDMSVLTSSVVSRAQNDSTLSSTLVQEEERINIVSCFLRPHDGAASDKPYSISPPQLVIPGLKSKTVDLTFTPLPTSEVGREMDCFGFALGYLSLDHEDADVSHIDRKEGYEADCLRLDFTAHLKPALLTVEETDDEGMRYRSAMSDLLKDKKVSCESLRVSLAMLSNNTLTPLNFKMMVREPFVLVDLETSNTMDNSDRAEETRFCTLNPGHNMMAKVAFCVSTDLLRYVQWEPEENDSDNNKLTFEDELVIEFDNGAQQRVPLLATLAVPQIELSTDVVDFGTCLVGQTRELEMFVINKTASHSFWNTIVEQTSPTCDQDTFKVLPKRGMLEAHITHVSKSKTFLKVFFTAKHSEDYEAVILFKGQLGESHQRLRLLGRGSYDGKHEAFLNV